jgi:hypothetical protein
MLPSLEITTSQNASNIIFVHVFTKQNQNDINILWNTMYFQNLATLKNDVWTTKWCYAS